MKLLSILSVSVLMAVAPAEAEDLEPKPLTIPDWTSGIIEEPALPIPDTAPENSGPTLLPESDELPAMPRADQPTRVLDQASIKPPARERARFEEVQSMAMGNPRVTYLLKRARKSSSASARRLYLRAYYSTLAARMRKLDPGLKSSIDAYEEAKVHQIAGSASPSNGSSHRSRSHRQMAGGSHHGSRRIATRHRYERMMILYDPYGPYLPPYGPPWAW